MSHKPLKSIFSSSGYRKGLLGFCDICFDIIKIDKKLYYTCDTCESFIACHHCIENKRHRQHPAHHSFSVAHGPAEDHWIHMNIGISCGICKHRNFTGKRYQCQTCLPSISFDVCSSCLPEADLVHPKHNIVFVSNENKMHNNRWQLASRAIILMNSRGSKTGDRDDITGWSMAHAEHVKQEAESALGKSKATISRGNSSALSLAESDDSPDTQLQNIFSQLFINTTAAILLSSALQSNRLVADTDSDNESEPQLPSGNKRYYLPN